MDKRQLKEDCVKLYLQGKTYTEIAKLTNWSRTFIANLIKQDERIINFKNNKKVKVCKRKNNQMVIYIPTEFIEKIGITKDLDKTEYVDIILDENFNNLLIKKHN